METKQLDKELIRKANYNSFGGKRGDIEEHEYQTYCETVISWGLSERKTQKILDKVYAYFSRSLSLGAQHVSVAVAGGSNYNATRLDKSENILRNSSEFCAWFDDLRQQAEREPFSRIEWLTKDIIWGVSDGYSVTKEWKELAGRSRSDFEALYDRLSKKFEFKKTSVPYKIYHNILAVEPITRIEIYSDQDFCVYEEQGKVCIYFRMKPQRQLIVALKARHFAWIASEQMWRTVATEDVREWAETIAERYQEYI